MVSLNASGFWSPGFRQDDAWGCGLRSKPDLGTIHSKITPVVVKIQFFLGCRTEGLSSSWLLAGGLLSSLLSGPLHRETDSMAIGFSQSKCEREERGERKATTWPNFRSDSYCFCHILFVRSELLNAKEGDYIRVWIPEIGSHWRPF